jgi:hypothetical protein
MSGDHVTLAAFSFSGKESLAGSYVSGWLDIVSRCI